ncbi:preprotein translocase subunit SecE [Stieleria varia]|uniref:Protein translocase subunit SecE n=1 Tax=Stieleria varia TaxID=2528005 RepID=A0A5C6AWU5_9BACT|nr:preprotein translocase subunit SecE [Stieleria varia]TWU02584.1 preprotein translocase subunit SecE [Stieleria varia]
MSREIAGASSGTPLLNELFQASVYKPNQGRVVRQLTVLAIWVIVAFGCWRLYSTLSGSIDNGYAAAGIPSALLAIGLWFGYRLVNWPRFADFLIAVEAEMNKVTWPSRGELIRASVVVVVTIAVLAISLFLFDIFWQWFFSFFWTIS